jgi:hypothetical protein
LPIFHDETVHGLNSKGIQADEIWSFVYAKQKNVADMVNTEVDKAGDAWTWTGIGANRKLIVSWYVGDRDAYSAYGFIKDITTDGYKAYLSAVPDAFGSKIDYANAY